MTSNEKKGFKLVLSLGNATTESKSLRNMTLGEIMNQSDKLVVDKSKGTIHSKKITDTEIVSITYTQIDKGMIKTESIIDVVDTKSEYKETIDQLYHEEGKTQTEIAECLNISQSYVSKMLRK